MVTEMRAVLLALLGPSAIDAWAGIYTCIGTDGELRHSDRPIAECADREQRRFPYPDGPRRRWKPPTPDERAAFEAKSAYNDAVRRDRNLKKRYPNEDAHRMNRQAALAPVEQAMSTSRARLEQLTAERKLLLEQAEFHRGESVPQDLKDQIAANDASMAAQLKVIQVSQAEQTRINKIFDMELEQLRPLWNGAQPGSLWVPPQPKLWNSTQPGSVWPPQP
jgi:hypothetical protein